MPAGFVGVLSVDLHLPDSVSLKDKRAELRRLKHALARGFAASVAEVDHHDLWQRARLTLAVVGSEVGTVAGQVEAAARRVHSDPVFVVLEESREVREVDGEASFLSSLGEAP